MNRPEPTSILFAVIGRGEFPTDMLRHDACWPADTTSARAIVERDMVFAYPSNVERHRTVYLRHVSGWGDLAAPDVARWTSFGWGVELIRADRGGEDVTHRVQATMIEKGAA